MENKLYKVFEIDKCFESYASDTVLVGAESVQDVLDHINKIFPDAVEKVVKEDWMDSDDWDEATEHGKYKDGDTKVVPYFTNEQIEEFNESLNEESRFPRIKEIQHMFTDTPYVYLTGFGYIE